MFLDWTASLQLLVHDPETHILRDFSLPVQKVLVAQVVTFLCEGHISAKVLTSPAHVCWAMEVVGQGFSLPIDQEDSISKAISLYRIWSLEHNHQPAPIKVNLQFFLQKIIQQSSLLFKERSYASPNEGDIHAKLCSKVLDIYLDIARKIGPHLTVETWEVLLKILIGTCDNILRQDAHPSVEVLQRKLCSQMHFVLFEVWLLSKTQNPHLWQALRNRVQGWTRHMPLIVTWKITCFALTKRMISILYEPSSESKVHIKFGETVQSLELEDNYVFYAWNKLLTLIGNPADTVTLPPNLLAFMSAVELLVNLYIKIGYTIGPQERSENGLLAPNGNTILHIFGSWLFDTVMLNRPGCDEGTALAMKILLNIMQTKHKTVFLPTYLSQFFGCVKNGLETDGRLLISSVTNSQTLLNKDIRGVRCLVPVFLQSIQRVLTGQVKNVESVIPPENLRKSCMEIFSTMICLPNQLGHTPFVGGPALCSLKARTYTDLKPHFSSILTEALTKESHLENIEFLLNLSYTWIVEDIDNDSDFTRQIIGLILRKITQNRWTPDIMVPSFKILSSLSRFYGSIHEGHNQATLVVDQLCRLVMSIGNPPKPNMDKISVLALECITHWIMMDQWVFSSKEVRKTLLLAIVTGLTGNTGEIPEVIGQPASAPKETPPPTPTKKSKSKDKKKKDEKEKEEKKESKKHSEIEPELSQTIQIAANYALLTLLNHTGNFPTRSGTSVISSMALEDEILTEIVEGSQGTINNVKGMEFMRYYITDERVIICVIDRPYHVNGPCTSVIVRDKSGRYAWDTSSSFSALSETPPQVLALRSDPVPITTVPFQPTSIKPMDVKQCSHVLQFLEDKNSTKAFKTVEAQVQNEYKVLKGDNFRLGCNISIELPQASDSYEADCKFQVGRTFLSNLGYLSMENRSKLFPLQMSSHFFQALQKLDSCSERNCIRVGVTYGTKGQDFDGWYSNVGGSLDYQEFVSTLGWGISASDHHGFIGDLGKNPSAKAPYWADFNSEVIFQVPSLLPDTDIDTRRHLLLNCSVMVVWLEEFENFNAQSIWQNVRYNILIIVITPLDFGLYSVRVFNKDDMYCIGPICDSSVVSKGALGRLVRDTALLASQKEASDKPTTYEVRAECIERIYESFKQICNLQTFYTSTFASLESVNGNNVIAVPKLGRSLVTSSTVPLNPLGTPNTIKRSVVVPKRAPPPKIERTTSAKVNTPTPSGRGRGRGRGRGLGGSSSGTARIPPPVVATTSTGDGSVPKRSPRKPARPPPSMSKENATVPTTPAPRGRGRGKGMGVGVARPPAPAPSSPSTGWGTRTGRTARPGSRASMFGSQRSNDTK